LSDIQTGLRFHRSTAISLNNLGLLYRTMGAYAKAEPLFQEALRIRQKILGAESRDTATSLNNLALLQIMSDFYEAAHHSENAPEALAEVQRNWLVKLRTEKGLAQAVNLAGPFIMSSQGRPSPTLK
jgi:tetratricopeptide (TPR) repeat protein